MHQAHQFTLLQIVAHYITLATGIRRREGMFQEHQDDVQLFVSHTELSIHILCPPSHSIRAVPYHSLNRR
ncbi:hypothetical protein HBH82_156040 [Parastagonospora nodorum]|nr:hypothetical protein HBH82_156040 [Parastagonospora nodorum]